MGKNGDASACSSTGNPKCKPDETTFRFKVVEHLSWGAYDSITQKFLPGHEDNKPIAGRRFKIKMPNGNIIEKTTDENGIIEFSDQDPVGKFEVTFEPGNAALNSKYSLFYNRTAVVETEV